VGILILEDMLQEMVERKASDLHIKVGTPPFWRIFGNLEPTQYPPPSAEELERIVFSLLDEAQREILKEKKEIDLAKYFGDLGRFRINIFKEKGNFSLAIRHVYSKIPSVEELGLPSVVTKLAEEPRGLILVTGTAGSGKTTTIAAMIEHINQTRRANIITIEDPIEIVFEDKKSVIRQRELGIDTDSYAEALKNVVRQDPDVIFIGEMRDEETVRAALTAAETGHLVFSTLHTIDATETVNRIIDFFPPYQQGQIRIMLAFTLKGIVSQRLLPKIGKGQVPAVEVMVNTATIRDYILKPEETHKIKDAIEEGEYYGMQSFEQSLVRLYQEGKVTLEDAAQMSANPQDFMIKLKQQGIYY
jgi:twitching motility protein PilT